MGIILFLKEIATYNLIMFFDINFKTILMFLWKHYCKLDIMLVLIILYLFPIVLYYNGPLGIKKGMADRKYASIYDT